MHQRPLAGQGPVASDGQGWGAASNPFPPGRHHYAFSLLTPLPSSPTILDYGCWDGGFIHRVSQLVEGSRAIGCDVDGEAIASADEVYGDAVTYFTVEAGAQPLLPLDDSSVSVAFLCDVLEHLGDGLEATVVDELVRVLAPGGALIITVPHRGALAWADPENFKFRWPSTHRRVFSWLHGAETYAGRYGNANGCFGNFSSGARWHRHYSVPELEQALTRHGLRLDATRHYGLLSPIIFTGLSMAERFAGRMGRKMRWMTAPLWFLRRVDASVCPGRLSYDVAVRAIKMPETESPEDRSGPN